jgi:hypothetical protein
MTSVEATFISGIQDGLKNPHDDLPKTTNGKFQAGWYNPKLRNEVRALYRYRLGYDAHLSEIDEAILKDTQGQLYELDAQTISGMVHFSFAEFKRFGAEPFRRGKPRHPSLLRPIDATPDEIKQYLREFHRPRKKEAERRRRQRNRERRQAAGAAPSRAEAIFIVIGVTFMTIAKIMTALKDSAAFKRKVGKGYLNGNSLRSAILAEIKKAPLRDKLVIKEDKHSHGLPQFLVRRKKD